MICLSSGRTGSCVLIDTDNGETVATPGLNCGGSTSEDFTIDLQPLTFPIKLIVCESGYIVKKWRPKNRYPKIKRT